MNMLKTCGQNHHQLAPSLISSKYRNANVNYLVEPLIFGHRRKQMQRLATRASNGGEKQSERRSFLTLEEAGLVEVSGLSTHERFLCRLTVRYGFNLYKQTDIVIVILMFLGHFSLLYYIKNNRSFRAIVKLSQSDL